jgi:hypothetical protein
MSSSYRDGVYNIVKVNFICEKKEIKDYYFTKRDKKA